MGARAFIPMALAGAVLLTLAPVSSRSVAAAEPRTEAQQIIAIAKAQVGDPWRYGAKGPRAFDCSGLIIYSYTKAGDVKVIGNGKIRSARALYRYFKAKGLASRSNPRPGDIVIWGGGTHAGIYIGNGKAVSTLTSGVKVHKVHAVTARFTAYLHTGMWNKSTEGGSVKATAADPTPSTAIRHTDGLVNLRKGPGTGNRRITTLGDGARLLVLGKDQDARGRWWLKVKVGSRTGWVARWLTD
ncbi:MAG: NlpC/P60 family protein [Candidatus Limnocylindrales bacterium]